MASSFASKTEQSGGLEVNKGLEKWKSVLRYDAGYCVASGIVMAGLKNPLGIHVGVPPQAMLGVGVGATVWGVALFVASRMFTAKDAETWPGWSKLLGNASLVFAAGVAVGAAAAPNATILGRGLLVATALEIAAFGLYERHIANMHTRA
ncbi:Hypothetical Protein FCC1311_101812 [Hondaea fermentalgiana]|uniref:Uncharacterized protein n=1 Tax=Hondaea fermentalgiana TaxID=2315210 RepID=A0A2R5GW15_9STRA|nr:Hypothetical Protein FCC1311_101812 [Hondaea fermentalgiana]|eukprot:GBG33958.1 Hypothetical Protein FCC1311_101812 [Hondaea fermentalgiana]